MAIVSIENLKTKFESGDSPRSSDYINMIDTLAALPEASPAGVNGDSAYQIAVNNGFIGTEQEWLDSLVGLTGATGAQGPAGSDGATGATGPKGDKGDPGTTDYEQLDNLPDLSVYATQTYADNAATTAVAAAIDSAPATLNTLNELAAAINDDASFASTVTTALGTKAPIDSPTFTGTVAGITKSMVGLGNVDNTSDANKPVSTAQQTALNLKSNLEGPTFTGTVTLPSTTSIGNVSATEIGYIDGVTSAIQTQLDGKDSSEQSMTVALSDEATAITTGVAKLTFRAPFAMTFTKIPRASLTTASTSGIPTVDINEDGTSILSTKLTIDANEKTSTTAATAAVLNDTAIADDAELTFDIDVSGTGAKGLKVTLYYKKA